MGMRIIQVTIEHEFGDLVYLKTDPDAKVRIVLYYTLNPGRLVKYTLQAGEEEPTDHYGFEIVSELSEVEAAYRNLVD